MTLQSTNGQFNWRLLAAIGSLLVSLSGAIGVAVSHYASVQVSNAQRDDKLLGLDGRVSTIEKLTESNDRALNTISTQFADMTVSNDTAHQRLESEIKEVKQLVLDRNHSRNAQYPLNGSIYVPSWTLTDGGPAIGTVPARAAAKPGTTASR